MCVIRDIFKGGPLAPGAKILGVVHFGDYFDVLWHGCKT